MTARYILARSTARPDEGFAQLVDLRSRLEQLAEGVQIRFADVDLCRRARPSGPCTAVYAADGLLGYVFAIREAG